MSTLSCGPVEPTSTPRSRIAFLTALASAGSGSFVAGADPVIAFGYGVIDAEDIPREMARFRQRAERELGPFDRS